MSRRGYNIVEARAAMRAKRLAPAVVEPATSEEEIAKLLELAEAAAPRRVTVDRSDLMRAFLDDNRLLPGRCSAVETCSLYKFYLQWRAGLAEAPALLPPNSFALKLRKAGFRHVHKLRRAADNGRERRVLGMRLECANRLAAWRALNLETIEDRALFTRGPRRPRSTPQELP